MTSTAATLNVGGVTDTFTLTTLIDPTDTTPDSFSFTDQVDVVLNTVISSNAITVSGINAMTNISIVGGEYALNGGSFSTDSGSVNNADTVQVRVNSSIYYATH